MNKYDVFISYHQDEYNISVAEKLYGCLSNLQIYKRGRKKLLHVFLDKEELGIVELSATIRQILDSTEWLLVICPPNNESAYWVKKEIKYFLEGEGHKSDHILNVFLSENSDNSVLNELLNLEGKINSTADFYCVDKSESKISKKITGISIKIASKVSGQRDASLRARLLIRRCIEKKTIIGMGSLIIVILSVFMYGTFFRSFIKWKLEKGVLTISGRGQLVSEDKPWVGHELEINRVVIEDGITEIGNEAFCECTELTDIVIPESVESIGAYAFADCGMLTEIVLPDNLKSIGEAAFSCCTDLTVVNIPEHVEYIGKNAFQGCTSLQKIDISQENQAYSFEDGALYNKEHTKLLEYVNADNLSSYQIQSGVEIIGESAFGEDCGSIKDIIMPESVIDIQDDAFSGCCRLQTINIPAHLSYIDIDILSEWRVLQNITVNTDNEAYSFEDGVLYNKDQTELVLYLYDNDENSYQICEGVKIIKESAFADCSNLTAITLPDGLEKICDSAFAGCTHIKTISIPDSVTSIAENAFWGCFELETIYFGGTKNSWKEIWNIENTDNEKWYGNVDVICEK